MKRLNFFFFKKNLQSISKMFYQNLTEMEVKLYGNFLILRALQKFRRYFKKIIVEETFWNILKINYKKTSYKSFEKASKIF